ncbi:MAG: hypothetical protein O7G83_13910 [Proteobacteria bacterium]|nr:hypothetical protein [Pseudomonadota bacterium]
MSVFGSDEFDVATIDTSTLDFGGASPSRCHYEDALMEGPTANWSFDGFTDLVCQYRTSDVAAPAQDEDCISVDLNGALLDGSLILGSDHRCAPGEPTCDAGVPIPLP